VIFEYLKYETYFAQCGRGLEDLLAEELTELGASRVKPAFRGVKFQAERQDVYRIVYCTRLASRVLAPLLSFDCHTDKYLYETAGKIDWTSIMTHEQTFMINAQVANSNISHSQFAAQKLKDGIVDQIRTKTGKRPSVDRRQPDFVLNLNIQRNRATISLDIGGGPLHKRGYRQESVEAPMQETLASAIIRISGWDAETPLVDPMCGSGTLLAEALMHASRIPASWLRMKDDTPLKILPDFDETLWRRVKGECDDRICRVDAGLIRGNDKDMDAVMAARENLTHLPGGRHVEITHGDFRKTGPLPDTTIVTNPPYGVRLQDIQRSRTLTGLIGDFLKQECPGSTAWLLCGDKEQVKSIGLKASRRIPLWNGGLECRLVKLELYAGKGPAARE
jgi:23S rRNA (guanine2445-N2)-methyltransferase